MGRKIRLKRIRKLLPENAKRPKTIDAMIECPFCHAWGYPRIHRFPKTEKEKKAILCPSCHKDLTPIIEERRRTVEMKEAVKEYTDGQGMINVQNAPLEISIPTKEG